MPNVSAEFLAQLLRKNLAGEPWHGAGTLDLLHRLSAKQAAARPLAERTASGSWCST